MPLVYATCVEWGLPWHWSVDCYASIAYRTNMDRS